MALNKVIKSKPNLRDFFLFIKVKIYLPGKYFTTKNASKEIQCFKFEQYQKQFWELRAIEKLPKKKASKEITPLYALDN